MTENWQSALPQDGCDTLALASLSYAWHDSISDIAFVLKQKIVLAIGKSGVFKALGAVSPEVQDSFSHPPRDSQVADGLGVSAAAAACRRLLRKAFASAARTRKAIWAAEGSAAATSGPTRAPSFARA